MLTYTQMEDESKHYKKQVLVLFDQFVVKLDNWSESSGKKNLIWGN